ncbi:MAG: hypothetical protein HRU09_18955 [Oligoflexales bacterium]|nr:hypothetical protein [Oligoflexales bacterium]
MTIKQVPLRVLSWIVICGLCPFSKLFAINNYQNYIEQGTSLLPSDYHQRWAQELVKMKREKGFRDPAFPAKLEIKPDYVILPEELRSNLNFDQALIYLLNIDLDFVETLTEYQLINLLGFLETIPMKLKWSDASGKIQSGRKRFGNLFKTHWTRSNGAQILTMLAGMKRDCDLLHSIITADPNAAMFALKGKAASVMDVKVTARALLSILSKVNSRNTRQVASSAQSISQVYIEYWSSENPDQLVLALTELVFELTKQISENKISLTLKQKGVLLGAILAGSMAHAHKIKAEDERRLWVVNSISNLAWAATTLIGTIPIAGSITSGVAGTLSIGVVIWAVVYNKIGVRNYTPRIKEVEGHIEFAALEIAESSQNPRAIVDVLETLAWMRAAIHINGFFD